jgi:hypothetical protein
LRDRLLAAVPLVAVTESREEAQLLSAQAMVTKPVGAVALEQLVVRLSAQIVV